jgi:hypothetical protein
MGFNSPFKELMLTLRQRFFEVFSFIPVIKTSPFLEKEQVDNSFAWFIGWLFGYVHNFRKSVQDGEMFVTDFPASTALSSVRR